MDEFLLLTLVLVYLAISYVPLSEAQEDIHRQRASSLTKRLRKVGRHPDNPERLH